MASFKRPDLIQILDGSFDAGLMIDKKGKVRYANVPSQQLFERVLNEESSDDLFGGVHIDALMEFEKPDGSYSWREVYPSLQSRSRSTSDPVEWTVKFPNQSKASMRLVKVSSPDHNDYILAFIRQFEDASTSNQKNGKTFDASEDAMVAIDQSGVILMMNHTALEQIDWLSVDLIGQNIASPLGLAMVEHSHDPVICVDELGNITSVNEAAIDHVEWIDESLVGQSVLNMKVKEAEEDAPSQAQTEDETETTEQESSHGYYSSWFASTPTKAKAADSKETPSAASHHKRKKPPEVIRVFLVDTHSSSSVVSSRGGNSSTLPGTFANSVTHNSDSIQRHDSIMMAVVEASLDPLFQINEKGIIQMCNKAALRQFGYTREEFIGSNISIIVGGGHAKNHDKYIARYLQTGITNVIGQKRELTARRSDGTEFPIELGVVEVDTFTGEERLFCGFVHDLSSIKKKERTTNDIVEASLDPMFLIGESGKIRMVNQAALKQFQYSRDKLLGNNISTIVGGGHAVNHDSYLKKYCRSRQKEGNVVGKLRDELQARRKDGTEFPIQLGVVEMKTTSEEERMFCGFIHDLTQIKHKERISHGIIESSLDAMLQIDDHGTIEMVNEAAVNTLGYARDELIGANINMIVGGGHAKHHDGYLRKFRATGKLNLVGRRRELKARKKDGTEFPVEIYITAINDDITKDVKFCGFLCDLTESK